MRTFALLLVAGMLLAPQVGQACTQVNAHQLGTVTLSIGDYINISSSGTGCFLPNCGGEDLEDCYTVKVFTSCGSGGDADPVTIAGNNLSGNYRVDDITGNCLKLCSCP